MNAIPGHRSAPLGHHKELDRTLAVIINFWGGCLNIGQVAAGPAGPAPMPLIRLEVNSASAKAACLFMLLSHTDLMNLIIGAWSAVGLVVPGSYNKPQLPLTQAGIKLHAQTMPN